jgi:tetratricopeptide (TPR) repeat protein
MNSIKIQLNIFIDNLSKTVKPKVILSLFCLFAMTIGCSKNVTYSPEHIAQTSGRYLYSQDEVLDVYYDHGDLFLKWRGADRMEPVVMDENTFFVVDMYKKLRFVVHPETKKRYLGIVSAEDESVVTYDYLKVADSFQTPSMLLKSKAYDKALEGYLEIQKQDSTSIYIEEREFNSLGYNYLRDKDYENAIAIFKINVALYPDSDNVYDSLADAYLRSGDSLRAFTNYSKALELNTGNDRAKSYVEHYSKSHH